MPKPWPKSKHNRRYRRWLARQAPPGLIKSSRKGWMARAHDGWWYGRSTVILGVGIAVVGEVTNTQYDLDLLWVAPNDGK